MHASTATAHPTKKSMIQRLWCQIAPHEKLLCDYATGDQWLHALLAGADHAGTPSKEAADAVEATMEPLILSDEQREALDRLRTGAAVVIGGQQVGHLGGPLYTWLKIASIIERARREHAVPIFWIEDNDHDRAEAQRVGVINQSDQLAFLDCPPAERYPTQTIVAACRIGPQITDQLAELERSLATLPFAKQTIAVLRQCYGVGRFWSEAFMEWHQQFWAHHGLLFVRSSILRQLGAMKLLLTHELCNVGQLAQCVREQTAELIARGYRAQLDVSTVNAFYHQGWRRYRIQVESESSFTAGQHRFNAEQLLDELDQHPEHFSPSAALRPLVQDALFAPKVSIVGPAELQYHAQLRSAYSQWGIRPPSLMLRHSATFVPERVIRLLHKHGDQMERFFDPQDRFDRWVAEILDRSGVLAQVDTAATSIADIMASLERAAEQDDPTLGRAVAATGHRFGVQLERLHGKLRHALRRQREQQLSRLLAARTHLFPGGRLQERVVAPIYWVCTVGIRQWSDVLLALAKESNHTHYIATPNELLSRVVGTQVVQ